LPAFLRLSILNKWVDR